MSVEYERTIYWAKADRPHWGDPVSRAVSRMVPDGWEFVSVGEEDEDREEIPVHFRRAKMAVMGACRRKRMSPVWVAGYRKQAKSTTAWVKRRQRARAFVRDLYALCERHGAALVGSCEWAYENAFWCDVAGVELRDVQADPSVVVQRYKM